MNAITGTPRSTALAHERSIETLVVSHDHSVCTWLSAGNVIGWPAG